MIVVTDRVVLEFGTGKADKDAPKAERDQARAKAEGLLAGEHQGAETAARRLAVDVAKVIAGNDDAVLRWNSCARVLMESPHLRPAAEDDEAIELLAKQGGTLVPTLAERLNLLIEHDELIIAWRYNHIQMVERMLGMKRGTGGSEDVVYFGSNDGALYKVRAADDELLVATHFPVWEGRVGFAFDEVARRHGDFALAGCAAVMIANVP